VYLLACLGGLTAIVSWVTLPPSVGIWVVLCVCLIGIEVAIVTDAMRTAQRASRPFVPRPYNRWYVYLLTPLFSALLVNIPVTHLLKRYVGEAFKIPTASMTPTILVGDYLYATPLRGTVRRGDIVIYLRGGIPYVKRIVGLAGDTLAMRTDSLFVNGRWMAEPYATPSDDSARAERPTWSTWGPRVVPAHAYFILGDNRGRSLDSRAFGPVDADSVVKRPIGIYFSRDFETGAIRWSRIGRSIAR